MPDESVSRARARRRTLLGSGLAALGSASLPAAEASAATPEATAPVPANVEAAAWTDPPNGYPEWNNNIGIFQVGSEPPHATFMPYADLAQALAGRPHRLALPARPRRRLAVPARRPARRPRPRLPPRPTSTTAPGPPCRCPPTGSCTATTSRSTSTSPIPGGAPTARTRTPSRLSRRPGSTRSASTAGPSIFPPGWQGRRRPPPLRGRQVRLLPVGQRHHDRLPRRLLHRLPSSTSPTTSGRAPT